MQQHGFRLHAKLKRLGFVHAPYYSGWIMAVRIGTARHWLRLQISAEGSYSLHRMWTDARLYHGLDADAVEAQVIAFQLTGEW